MTLKSLARQAIEPLLWSALPSFMEARRAVRAYPKIKDTGVAFIHIPKAAGMSVSEALYGEQIGHLKWGDIYKSNPRAFEGLLKVAVCRDPFDRFVSAFWFLKNGGINEADKTFAETYLAEFDDPSALAIAMCEEAFRKAIFRKVHFHTQASFVCAEDGTIMVDHLVHFERLADDLPRVLGSHVRLDLAHKNKGPGSSIARGDLSKEARSALGQIYAEDIHLCDLASVSCDLRGRCVPSTNTSRQAASDAKKWH